MSNTLAAKTLERVSTGMKSGQVACLPELLKLISSLSQRALDMSVDDLSELIQKDAAILAKVLAAANTLFYNPSAFPVSTVTQAIHVIGFEHIRTLTVSLMLLEHASRARSPEEQREAASHALCAGIMAETAAANFNFIDAEQAFVCASLRNFGRIVLTTFMVDDFRTATQLADGANDDGAFRRIFGLTPLELGHQLLKSANLPEVILGALRECKPEAITATTLSPETRLLALSDFSAQFTELALKADMSAAEFELRQKALTKRFKDVLPDLDEHIPELLQSARTQMERFMRGFGGRSLPTQNVHRLRQRIQKIDPSASLPQNRPIPTATTGRAVAAEVPADADGDAGEDLDNPKPAAPPAVPAMSDWETGINRLTAIIRSRGGDRTALYPALVEIATGAFDAPETILFAARHARQSWLITHGQGTQWKSLQPVASIMPGERTVLGLCLTRHENVLIHNATEANIAPHLPTWLRGVSALSSFVLLPLWDQQRVHGILLLGWPTPRQIVITPAHAQQIRTLLALATRSNAAA